MVIKTSFIHSLFAFDAWLVQPSCAVYKHDGSHSLRFTLGHILASLSGSKGVLLTGPMMPSLMCTAFALIAHPCGQIQASTFLIALHHAHLGFHVMPRHVVPSHVMLVLVNVSSGNQGDTPVAQVPCIEYPTF